MKKLASITTAAILSLAVSAAAPAASLSVYAAPVTKDETVEFDSPGSIDQTENFSDSSEMTDSSLPELIPCNCPEDLIRLQAYCQEEYPDGQESGCIGTGTVEWGMFACLG